MVYSRPCTGSAAHHLIGSSNDRTAPQMCIKRPQGQADTPGRFSERLVEYMYMDDMPWHGSASMC